MTTNLDLGNQFTNITLVQLVDKIATAVYNGNLRN